MRISVIPTIRHYPWGAPGHCMGELVKELLIAGHNVQWFVAPIDLQRPEVERLARRGAVVVKLPEPAATFVRLAKLRREIYRWAGASQSLEEAVRRFSPDHIFLNDGGTWSGVGDEYFELLQKHRGRYSLICHLNQPQDPFCMPALQKARALASGASKVFFNSKWCHRLAELQIAQGVGNGALYQLPLRYYPEEPLAWPDSPIPRFAMVTRLDCRHKGLDLALQAFSSLRKENVELSLSIVGSGADEDYLRALKDYLQLGSSVVFRPHVEDLAGVWMQEEMLVLPSRYEGLGVSMLEAMSFGRPILRTPYGGCEEWVEDGVNGFVCPAAEVELLVCTLKRALSKRRRWREMGLAAHARIKRDLDSRAAQVFLEALHS